MKPGRIVVVGGGAAGLNVLQALREEGYAGELALIGEEPMLPYDRPPLSKQALAAPGSTDHALISPAAMDALRCDVHLGERAMRCDAVSRVVTTSTGRTLPYDVIVAATGLRARVPSWAEGIADVHVLRSAGDAAGLASVFGRARQVLVIGAGFLGTEIAASATRRGLVVTIVDTQPAPMNAQLGSLVAQRIAQLHREHGVTLRCGVGVRRLIVEGGRGRGAELSDGTLCRADVVVLATGSRPAVEWLTDFGVDLADGLVCDAYCRAAPGLFGAGDVASYHSTRFGRRLRLEHRMNATEQAIAVARNILGAEEAYDPIPFFWSDQFDVRIQVHGIIEPDLATRVLWGDPSSNAFVIGYCGAQGMLRGVLGWNAAREARRWRAKVGEPLDFEQADGGIVARAPKNV